LAKQRTLLPLVNVAARPNELHGQQIAVGINAEQYAVITDPQTKEITTGQGLDMLPPIGRIDSHGFNPPQNLPLSIGRKAQKRSFPATRENKLHSA